MAKIGLNNFRYGILTEGADGTPTYAGAKTVGKAISCKVDISSNSASLYADDSLAESDTSFQNGTVTMGIANEDIATMGALLGHTVTGTAGSQVMVRNVTDIAPYVGFGRIITLMVSGSYQYKVEFLYKVKFSEPSQDNTTKGESVEFGTTEVSGVVSALANGNWSCNEIFTTKAEAITYLEGLLGTTGA